MNPCLTTIAGALLIGAVAPVAANPLSLTDIVEARSIDAVLPSPDGSKIAYRVISRSVREDRVTAQWFEISMSDPDKPDALGGQALPKWIPQFDVIDRPRAEWLSDGSSILAIQIDQHGSQLHQLRAGQDLEITRDPADIEDFRVSGTRIEIAHRRPLGEIRALQQKEFISGIHLDRTLPTEGMRLTDNFVTGQRATTVRRRAFGDLLGEAYSGDMHWYEVTVREERTAPTAAPGPAARMAVYDVGDEPLDGRMVDLGGRNRLHFHPITTATASEEEVVDQIFSVSPDGTETPCRESFCTGPSSSFRRIIYDREKAVWIIGSEPDYSGQTHLYEWDPASGHSQLLYASVGRLRAGSEDDPAPCPVIGNDLVCVEAGPMRPDRLVAINLEAGRERNLADPNSELAARDFPRVESLAWKDADGQTTRGVLVLPNGTQPFPLVITTYRCQGFLRGATSNLTPEFMLAARGIAALCVNNNNLSGHGKDATGKERLFGEQDAAIGAYRAIIEHLARDHVVDPTRVGISGHSFTGNLIAYALTKTSLFAAAEIGSGITIDPNSYYLTAPEANSWRRAAVTANGLPSPANDPADLWKQYSPALNASKIRTPLLFQIPEVEYLMSLQLFGSLDELQRPVDMYIYPMAGHDVGRSPAQQVSRGARSVDWFSYWLLPGWRAQHAASDEVRYWDELRARSPLGEPAHGEIGAAS